ncbi:hypothetical protein LCGC14_1467290 [marine sediment metagenome]|uniref:Uncharacterized protein n=1 Tax=marine sediment metagenome TaxID=412755 RepID=A0A0F9MFC1_9ZZZZ
MGCSAEDRKILFNPKVSDVNINHYVKLNYEQYIHYMIDGIRLMILFYKFFIVFLK